MEAKPLVFQRLNSLLSGPLSPNAGVQAPARPRQTGPVPADVPARRSPATTGSAEPVRASRAELRVRRPAAPGRAPARGVARLVRGATVPLVPRRGPGGNDGPTVRVPAG